MIAYRIEIHGPLPKTASRGSGTDLGPKLTEFSPYIPIKNKIYKTTHLIDYKAVEKPDCGDENTECIEEYVDVELTNERTQYFCKFIQLPEPNEKKSKHMIGYQPVNNDTIGVLHHVIIYTCSGKLNNNQTSL